MQVQNIKRPQLFTEFFTEVLIWNNEFLTYIKTSIQKSSTNVTSKINNIKKSLKYINNKFESKRFNRRFLKSRMFQTRIEFCKKRMKLHPTITDDDCIAF